MIDWIYQPVARRCTESLEAARAHQMQLTKPSGSLGDLEVLAEKFAAWQGNAHPRLENIVVRVFAGDHGICAQNVSAFPQEVTVQMISNFLHGGAAISVLSKNLDADFRVVNVGTVNPVEDAPLLDNLQLAAGTADASRQPAMTQELLAAALQAGRDTVKGEPELFIGGEMGIGNTTSASALFAALLELPPEAVTGRGTGLDEEGVTHKRAVIATALALHATHKSDPVQLLRCLGGLEIAALTGAYLACAQSGIPVLVDGFICSAAALVAMRISPDVAEWLLFSHQSAEMAHQSMLEHMQIKPLLHLGMRLGEGSGAAVAVPIIQNALLLHRSMSTFADAGVSSKT